MRALQPTLLMVLAVAAFTAVWVAIVRGSAPSTQAAWTEGLYNRKEAAANSYPNGKILIIGGSGAHYGFSARQISEYSGLNVVNFGTHAGLGLPYILDRARRVLKPNDTALLVIEPTLYFGDRTSSFLSEYTLRYDIAYLTKIPLRDALAILYGYSPLGVIQEEARQSVPRQLVIGDPTTVSQFGDETLKLSKLQLPFQLEALKSSSPIPISLPATPPARLAEFLNWARSYGVRLAFAWTPMLNFDAYQTPRYRVFFEKIALWYLQAGAVQLGDPIEYFQPIENMFDYIFHDNERGRFKASSVLARRLCDHYACGGTKFAAPSIVAQ